MPCPLLQPLDNHAVCIVHYRCPDRVEVDARGLFVVVAEGFADDRKGHIPVPGYGGPGVAGTIRGQRYGQAELLPDFLQMPVYLLHLAFVLGTFRAVLPRNEVVAFSVAYLSTMACICCSHPIERLCPVFRRR